jgi:hypothetical protein
MMMNDARNADWVRAEPLFLEILENGPPPRHPVADVHVPETLAH